jgi:hypothetical protein
VSFILIPKPKWTCLPITAVRRQLKPVFHFTTNSLAASRSITLKQHFRFTFYTLLGTSGSPFNIQVSSPGLTIHFDLCWTKLQFGRIPIHSGRTKNKPQCHLRQFSIAVALPARVERPIFNHVNNQSRRHAKKVECSSTFMACPRAFRRTKNAQDRQLQKKWKIAFRSDRMSSGFRQFHERVGQCPWPVDILRPACTCCFAIQTGAYWNFL